ncbi:hypothetical protein QYE76_009543 [Lolium multiflorum]|uniref:Uncharacterized protein n=1 Tax=Lolium multiflorum TaxID=4521 RepID=A0AAD8TTC2_LOLMU|nr:hypothetical protein QYE76_009543 [Lolium multiflorum]
MSFNDFVLPMLSEFLDLCQSFVHFLLTLDEAFHKNCGMLAFFKHGGCSVLKLFGCGQQLQSFSFQSFYVFGSDRSSSEEESLRGRSRDIGDPRRDGWGSDWVSAASDPFSPSAATVARTCFGWAESTSGWAPYPYSFTCDRTLQCPWIGYLRKLGLSFPESTLPPGLRFLRQPPADPEQRFPAPQPARDQLRPLEGRLLRKLLRLRSELRDCVLLSGGRVSVTRWVSVGIDGFPDEDVDAADWDDGELDGIMAAPTINFNQFLEKEKLKSNGSNFTDWFRHVRIFLTGGNLQYVLEAPLGPPPSSAVSEDVKNVYETRVTRYSQVQCAILCSLEAELQKRFEHHDPYELVSELKAIFETHAAVESYEASKHFFGCMMEEGSSVSEHVLAMSGHAKKLSDLGIVIPNQLGIHRVLQSLPPSYKNFVMNYNMQNMNKELPELFSMLKSAEVQIPKEN